MKAKKGAAGPPPPPSLSGDAPLPSGTSSLRARMNASFEKNSVPDPCDIERVDVISSGSLCLDHALGVGGYARKRITTFAGPEHAGKTALALLGIGAIQRHIRLTENRMANVAIVDTEHAYSNSLAEVVGCDTSPDTLIVLRPLVAEDALKMVMYALGYETKDKCRTWTKVGDAADVVLFDSWAGTATEGVGLAELARIGAAWLPTIAAYTNRANAFMFVCNHIREKPGVLFGDPEYEPGGRAFQHMKTVGMLVHRSETQKGEDKRPVSHDMRIDIRKNKLAPAYKRASLRLHYVNGFDMQLDLVRFCEIIGKQLTETRVGNIYTYKDIRANGRDNFVEQLRLNPDRFQELYDETLAEHREGKFNG